MIRLPLSAPPKNRCGSAGTAAIIGSAPSTSILDDTSVGEYAPRSSVPMTSTRSPGRSESRQAAMSGGGVSKRTHMPAVSSCTDRNSWPCLNVTMPRTQTRPPPSISSRDIACSDLMATGSGRSGAGVSPAAIAWKRSSSQRTVEAMRQNRPGMTPPCLITAYDGCTA
jgi:hypothetical protein